jgi:hypothetical protein
VPAPCQDGYVPQSFLEPVQAVDGQRAMLAGLQEALHVWQEAVAGWEEASAQPEQLPAPFLTVPAGGGLGSHWDQLDPLSATCSVVTHLCQTTHRPQARMKIHHY